MTEHEERECVAKARAEGKTASVTRGTTTTCYHPNGCVLVFDDGLIEESIKAALNADLVQDDAIDYSSITQEIAYDNTTD